MTKNEILKIKKQIAIRDWAGAVSLAAIAINDGDRSRALARLHHLLARAYYYRSRLDIAACEQMIDAMVEDAD